MKRTFGRGGKVSTNTWTQVGHQETLLYVDGLNYSKRFFTSMNFWNMRIPLRNIKEFYYAAKNSGITLEVFIDAGMQTEEAETKWKKRRE